MRDLNKGLTGNRILVILSVVFVTGLLMRSCTRYGRDPDILLSARVRLQSFLDHPQEALLDVQNKDGVSWTNVTVTLQGKPISKTWRFTSEQMDPGDSLRRIVGLSKSGISLRQNPGANQEARKVKITITAATKLGQGAVEGDISVVIIPTKFKSTSDD